MVSPNCYPSLKLETARTFVPGWWSHAFEAISTTSLQSSTDVQLCQGGLLPRFTPQELSVLAVLLGDIQRQILESECLEFVELDWLNSQKQLSGTDHSVKERLAGVFESLSQVRFPISTESGEIRCFPIFEKETWIAGPDAVSPQKVRLKPAPLALELLTGYTDTHLDMLRRLTGGPSLSNVNRGRLPLVLWTPVWLELTLAEQLLYARMEAAMQDESAWLRLDGLVGTPLEQLTEGLKLGKKGQDNSSLLMERLRLVGRLGRRLTAHGVIQKEPDAGFIAVESDANTRSPLLIWQATSERLKSRAEAEYFGLVSSKVLKFGLTQQISPLLSILSSVTSYDVSQVHALLKSVWESIVEIPGCSLVLGPAQVTQAHILFLEWIARTRPGSRLSLPERIQKNGIASALSDVSASNAGRKFREFLSIVGHSDDLRLSVKNDGQFSMAFGRLSSEIENICKKALISQNDPAGRQNDSLAENALKSNLNQQAAVPSNALSVKLESQKPTKQVTLAQNLRRLAQDELDKMIRQSPGAYADLKQKYIASLDEDTKSLVMDVQRRLGSRTFDRHLRIRLVHYMVEHPSSWNSISMSLQS